MGAQTSELDQVGRTDWRPGSERAEVGGPRSSTRRHAKLLLALTLLAAGIAYGAYWYVWSLDHESTDDAQVEGNICPISSHVSGYVIQRLVDDNQVVQQGQVLVRIQEDDYRARTLHAEGQLAQAEGNLAAAGHNLAVLRRSSEADIAQGRANVQQAEAKVQAARKDAESAQARLAAAGAARQQAQAQLRAAEAELQYATFNQQRVGQLHTRQEAASDEVQRAQTAHQAAEARVTAAREGSNSADAQVQAAQTAAESARAAVAVAVAAVEEQKAKLESALSGPDQVRAAEARVEVARADVASAKAQVELARLDLGYCTIAAPVGGLVSRRSVEAGQFVQPGQPFLAVVPLENTWVVANFKETQLRRMHAGQSAKLRVDAYPDHPFVGYIESIAAGTGARFSILPPENATGNFVKVVQRVPVKIVLAPGQRDPSRPLRPGMNVVVTVETSSVAAPTASAPAEGMQNSK